MATNNFTTNELYAEIEQRLASGSPFKTNRAAWQGYEFVARIDNDWFIGLDFNGHKVLALVAQNRRLAIETPKLPVGTRANSHTWKVLLDRPSFDRWAKNLEKTGKPRSIWQIFVEIVERQDIALPPGGEQIIWQSGQRQILIWRETGRDYLRLCCRNGKTSLSEPLAHWGRNYATQNGDVGGRWKLELSAQKRYNDFIQDCRS